MFRLESVQYELCHAPCSHHHQSTTTNAYRPFLQVGRRREKHLKIHKNTKRYWGWMVGGRWGVGEKVCGACDMFMVGGGAPPKIAFHGISGQVTRRFMWAFIKRTSVLAANHLVNVASTHTTVPCHSHDIFAYSFKMEPLLEIGIWEYPLFFPPPAPPHGCSTANTATKDKLDFCLFIFILANFCICCCLCHKNNNKPPPFFFVVYTHTHPHAVTHTRHSGLIFWHYCREVVGILFAFGPWLLWLTSADWQRISCFLFALLFCLTANNYIYPPNAVLGS